MMKDNFNLAELNQKFSIDNYLSCSISERNQFRKELLKTMKGLKSQFMVVNMRQEDVLKTGLARESKTAIALAILQEKTNEVGYDELFHFKDSIRILTKQLIQELFGGKNVFYDLGDGVVAYDPNYVKFILAKNVKQLRRALKKPQKL